MELKLSVGRLLCSLFYFACFKGYKVANVKNDMEVLLKKFFTNCYNLAKRNQNFFYIFLNLLNDQELIEEMLPEDPVTEIYQQYNNIIQNFELVLDHNINLFASVCKEGK